MAIPFFHVLEAVDIAIGGPVATMEVIQEFSAWRMLDRRQDNIAAVGERRCHGKRWRRAVPEPKEMAGRIWGSVMEIYQVA